jgi:hypothetical protein
MTNPIAGFAAYTKRLDRAAGRMAEALKTVQSRHPCDCNDGLDRRVATDALIEYQEVRSELFGNN